jgi:hypothetical protein
MLAIEPFFEDYFKLGLTEIELDEIPFSSLEMYLRNLYASPLESVTLLVKLSADALIKLYDDSNLFKSEIAVQFRKNIENVLILNVFVHSDEEQKIAIVKFMAKYKISRELDVNIHVNPIYELAHKLDYRTLCYVMHFNFRNEDKLKIQRYRVLINWMNSNPDKVDDHKEICRFYTTMDIKSIHDVSFFKLFRECTSPIMKDFLINKFSSFIEKNADKLALAAKPAVSVVQKSPSSPVVPSKSSNICTNSSPSCDSVRGVPILVE